MKKRTVESFVDEYGERMAAANEAFHRVRDAEWPAIAAFFAENNDALLAPDALAMLVSARHAVAYGASTPQQRESARLAKRMLLALFGEYVTPKRVTPELKLAGMRLARAEAAVDAIRTGEKLSVALARRAAEAGVVTPNPGAAYPSRAAQRAEQRARKKAGEPPRPRGRPARPR